MKNSRREFFKQSLGVVAGVVAFPSVIKMLFTSTAQAQAPAAGAAPKFVVAGQGMAASVGYTENKAKVEKSLQVDRNGTKFADQKCANCILFTKDAASANGKCQLFPTEMVKANSWCKSWSKKV